MAGRRPLRRIRLAGVALLASSLAWAFAAPPAAACPDPFAFLEPWIEVSDRDRQKIDSGSAVVRILSGEGREVAVLGLVAVDVGADRLVAWMHNIQALKQSERAPVVRRFSDPPVPADLAALELPHDDVRKLRECRPGNCDIKLADDEIARVRAAVDQASPDERDRAARQAFDAIVLDRLRAYRASGHAGIGGWADGNSQAPLADVARQLVARSPYLVERMPALAAYLTDPIPAPLPRGAESFFYWSVERFDGRLVMGATHVVIHRPGASGLPEVVVAGKQVFATHYQNGSLGLTMLLRGCDGGPNYLAYVNRSEVDVIGGMFGWLARRIIQGRVETAAAEVLEKLSERLAGPPPGREH